MNILDALIQKGLLKESQKSEVLRLAKEKYDGSIETALIKELGMRGADILKIKSEAYGVPTRSLVDGAIPFSVLKYIPEDSAKHYHFLPVGFVQGVLEVGVTDPSDIAALDALQFVAMQRGVPFKVFLISESDFTKGVESYRGISSEVDKAVTDFAPIDSIDTTGMESVDASTGAKTLSTEDEAKIVEDAPIIKIVDVIIKNATEGNASDIHIENTGNDVKVRFRVDGVLHTPLVLPLSVYAGVIARIKLKAQMRLDEKRKPQDGSYSVLLDGRKIDLRVSTFPAVYGEKIVMRILDTQKGVRGLDALDLRPEHLALVKAAIAKPYGLILITGPTGSGKSTTLYSMLNALDREHINVVSLENPVEYRIPSVSQSQVNPDIGYTFATGLRAILRQDPDVIMVGEIRDKETADLAIQAALTGHLVLSTLHTNSAVGAIPRLVDMGIDPYLIAPTLILSMAQRLARVTCESSRKEVPMDEITRGLMDKELADLPAEYKTALNIGDKMYEVHPSDECPTGTRGRMAVFEMFAPDHELQRIILTTPTENDLYKFLRNKGMISMKEDAMLKSLEGKVPFAEVYAEL
jgi:type IV pilus assembly protein PilB